MGYLEKNPEINILVVGGRRAMGYNCQQLVIVSQSLGLPRLGKPQAWPGILYSESWAENLQ